MNWTLFQLACFSVLAAAYAILLWNEPPRSRRARLIEILVIAIAAFAAEETCILRYRFYRYPDTWWLKLDQVPLLVALIWPMVILSSRALVDALFPGLGPAKKALAVGLGVLIDASLVETIAVAAGLWTWSEGGYLGVPLIGLIGWGAFAASMVWSLEEPKVPRWYAPLTALGGTHILLVATWWACFRHVMRGPLPPWSTWLAVAVLALTAVMLARRGGRIPFRLALPRLLATSIFVVLLFLYARLELVAHFAAVALLYVAVLELAIPSRKAPKPSRSASS